MEAFKPHAAGRGGPAAVWAGCQQVVLGSQEGKKIALDCVDLEGGHWN